MSRRARVPAPFQKFLPSVIRGAGPRLVLVATGCAALLILGGSSYVLSRVTQSPPAPSQQAPLSTDGAAPAKAEVLGAATTSVSNGATSAASTVPTTTGSAAAAPSTNPASTPTVVPCTSNCASVDPTAPVQGAVNTVTQTVKPVVQEVLSLPQHLLGGLL